MSATTRRMTALVAATAVLVPGAMAASAPAEAAPHATTHTAAAAVSAPGVSGTSAPSNIKALQYLLTAYGVPASADGSYGPGTTAAVKKFQARSGLASSGSADTATMGKLTGGANVRVTVGWKNASTVRAAQQLLIEQGYHARVDGTFDSPDAALVKSFQTAHKLPVTGAVDAATWAALLQRPGSATRKGAVYLLSQFGTDRPLAEQYADCGPTAMVVTQLRLGKKPGMWTDAAHRGPAIGYARSKVLQLGATDGTAPYGGSVRVLSGWQRVGIAGATRGTTDGATAAVRAGGVAMVVGHLYVARTWQGKSTTDKKTTHWVTLVDYDAGTGTYEIADSSHSNNRLVWVSKAALDTFQTGPASSVYAK